MKSPREILLERHRATASKLDAIRRECVGQASSLSQNKRTETGRMPVLLLMWRELVWPSRRIWAGLAAVWIMILAVNFSSRDHSQLVAEKSAPTAEMVLTWWQQQQLLAELLGPNETHTAAPPKPFSPQPSGERLFQMTTV